MNHRPMHYRRATYRRRRIRTVLIVVGVLLLVGFLLFLWIGNLFTDKMEAPEGEVQTSEPELTEPPLPAASVRKVQAPALSLREGTAKAQDALAQAAADGLPALSASLTDRDGTLLYHSEVSERLSLSTGNGKTNLATLCETADAYGIYLCGSFTLRASDEDNPLDRSVYLSEAAAVIAEAYSYGFRDVVLRAPDTKADDVAELIRLYETVKGFAPDAVLGLALPDAAVSAPDAATMEEWAYAFDYLALDLSRYGEDDPVAVAESQTDAMLYYLLRYQMRVLVPAEAHDDVIAKLGEFNIESHMAVE